MVNYKLINTHYKYIYQTTVSNEKSLHISTCYILVLSRLLQSASLASHLGTILSECRGHNQTLAEVWLNVCLLSCLASFDSHPKIDTNRSDNKARPFTTLTLVIALPRGQCRLDIIN